MAWRARLLQEFAAICAVDVPLAARTSWNIGGCAQVLASPRDVAEAGRLLAWLEREQIAWTVLGGGSNVLIADAGVSGVVLCLERLNRLEVVAGTTVVAGAGCHLARLVAAAAAAGLGGLEHLAGIPGSVGGAVTMNAGAHGQQIGDVLVSAEVFSAGSVATWPRQRFDFAYRHSAVDTGAVVLQVVVAGAPVAAAELRRRSRAVLERRRASQAVAGRSAGSVFKNPPGQSAWRLIAAAGMRAARVGAAQVAQQHCNFIVNLGSATSAEVVELMSRVQAAVVEHSGILLQPEVRFIGTMDTAARRLFVPPQQMLESRE